ncbi:MAG: acetyltransferase [Bacteroidetes bacterium]|nr:acetyltransferase [Bacteroidota bacterium]
MTKPPKPGIVIIGAGGHAKVICDAIIAGDEYHVAGFTDAVVPADTLVQYDYRVIAHQDHLQDITNRAEYFIVAIGSNPVREELYEKALQFFKPVSIIHPTAIIAQSAEIKLGAVCLAGSIVNSNCVISENVIINSGAVVDHDCIIEKNVHISIGTMVGSNSIVAEGVTTSIGERIESFSKIN